VTTSFVGGGQSHFMGIAGRSALPPFLLFLPLPPFPPFFESFRTRSLLERVRCCALPPLDPARNLRSFLQPLHRPATSNFIRNPCISVEVKEMVLLSILAPTRFRYPNLSVWDASLSYMESRAFSRTRISLFVMRAGRPTTST
jgi:hypothetical protein